MAPLPPESTERWFLDYTVAGEGHTLLMRSTDGEAAVDASAQFDAFLTAMDALLLEINVTGMRRALSGTNVSLPQTYTGATSFGSGTGLHYQSAQYFDFVGRGPSGKRVRASVFGANVSFVGDDFRMTAPENPAVAAAIAVLDGDANFWVTIAGDVPVWNPYANTGQNAYWRNKIR